MILHNSLKVTNYKCFADDPQGFEKIYPINILIGKNSSGKSSLLELIAAVSKSDDKFPFAGRAQKQTEIQYQHLFSREQLTKIIPDTMLHPEYYKSIADKLCTVKINFDKWTPTWEETEMPQQLSPHAQRLMSGLPLTNRRFRQISAERDMVPEVRNLAIEKQSNNSNLRVAKNGRGATSLLQSLLIDGDFRWNLKTAKIELLKELNSILNPDMVLDDILVQECSSDHTLWELLFESNGEFIKLSDMGSGIKTILLTLINLIIIPEVERIIKQDYIFGLEELENNLHPALLRRLLNYIVDYSKNNNCYFFITTHSSIVIDLFCADERAQIIHVTNNKEKSTCTQVSTFNDNKTILRDLEVRASDILQSNGIIWVEGPSDRTYLNKWLSLTSNFIEGYHYSIMFYGGKVLANLSLDEDWVDKEIVPLLKINTNAFVIMDRDGDKADKNLNYTKKRIIQEVGDKNCWVTKGREVENYLTKSTLENWLQQLYSCSQIVELDANSKLENILHGDTNKRNPKYNTNKKGFSAEIANYITSQDIDHLDLQDKLNQLKTMIASWNHIPPRQ